MSHYGHGVMGIAAVDKHRLNGAGLLLVLLVQCPKVGLTADCEAF